jgi:hypothetical protein
MERNLSGDGGERGEKRRGQRFQFGPWLFNIDEAQALIAEKPREAAVASVPPMAHFYGLDVIGNEGSTSMFTPAGLDREYAMTTDLEEPVIIAQLRSTSGGSFHLLIDGIHRLYRAYAERVDQLPAYVLSVDESLSIREDPFAGSPVYAPAHDGARYFTDVPGQSAGEE